MTKVRSIMGFNPHLQDEQVALYVDALKLNRTNELPSHLREHVAQCQACRKNITELYSLLFDEDYSKAGPHPFFDENKPSRSWSTREFIRMAAAIVALLGIAYAVYYIGVVRMGEESPRSVAGRSSTTSDSISNTRGVPTPEPTRSQELFAGRFEPWPPLEDMVNSEFRSGSLEAVEPKNGVSFGTKEQRIEFNWKGYSRDDVSLTVMDNTGKSIYTARVTTLPFVAGSAFPVGLYYWKIQNSSELMHVGKFRVQ